MRVSDYVIQFIENITDTIFLLSGGGIMHLVDSAGRSKKLHPVCCHHEQGAATAAEAYARIKNDIGVCLVTTGPGGTNTITGVAGAWLDSIPMLVISGQVKRDNIVQRKNGRPLYRALGFQELNIIDVVKPITKYAVTVDKEEDIRFQLEKAVYIAKSGRPGPVWVEIPLDVQGPVDKKTGEVNPDKLKPFSPPADPLFDSNKIPMDLIVEKLRQSKRPLLMAGNGIRLAGGEKILWDLVGKLKINVVTPLYTASDLVTYEYPYYLGRQGMWGNATANYAVDNCDLLLVVGERLQLTQTSFDYRNFATQATKIMVDVDEGEMHKKTVNIDIPVQVDAKLFLEELYKQDVKLNRWDIEVEPFNPDELRGGKKYANVHKFVERLGEYSTCNTVTANGMAAGTHKELRVKKGQRLIVTTSLGQMGYALPASIGVAMASKNKPVICIEGDGSIMLNIQELQTIVHHRLPIKIFIYNNSGYYSIRATHNAYFHKVFAADSASGVSLPDFEKIAKAFGLKFARINSDKELLKVKDVIKYRGPIICEIMIDPRQPMPPKWTAGQYRNKKNQK